MNERVHSLIRFFSYQHLKEPGRGVSALFNSLAHNLDYTLPPGAEKTVALRKLLEAKDAAVRSILFDSDQANQVRPAPGEQPEEPPATNVNPEKANVPKVELPPLRRDGIDAWRGIKHGEGFDGPQGAE